jgi:hypothetical protein
VQGKDEFQLGAARPVEELATHHQFANIVRQAVSVPDSSQQSVPSILPVTKRVNSYCSLKAGSIAYSDFGSIEQSLIEGGQSSGTSALSDSICYSRGTRCGVLVRDSRHSGCGEKQRQGQSKVGEDDEWECR